MAISKSGMNRRLFLAGVSATALLPMTATAQEGGQGVRFAFSIKGHPFGATITKLGKGLLLTLRSLKDASFRISTAFTPKKQDDSTEASIEVGERGVVTASVNKKGELTLSGSEDLKLDSVAMHPEGSPPPPQGEGLFGWLGKIASGIGNAITSAIGLVGGAFAWLFGMPIKWRNGWGEIQVFSDGGVWITVWGSNGPAGGFMPPPPGTEKGPGIWY